MSGGRQMLKERYNAGRREKVHEDVKRRQAAKAEKEPKRLPASYIFA